MKKYFPIKTETACKLKWAWSTVYLTDGSTGSCHRASIDFLNENNFFDFHNMPAKVTDREKMLSGQWPGNGCEYCRDIEEVGGFSDRLFHLSIPDNYPEELDLNKNLTRVSPTILEIFFKNTCNLLCIYCTEKYSSAIQAENKRHGYININDSRSLLVENKYDTLSPLLWKWLDNNFSTLKRLNILGGEPFLQDDFYKLIEFIDSNPNPNLELSIISNLIIKDTKFQNCLSKLEQLVNNKKIKRLDIQASVDSWGPGQEYIRTGFKLDQFDRNFKYLMSLPSVRVSILSTITSLSIFEMPMLLEKINEWSQTKKISWYLHNVLPHGTSLFDPKIFNYNLFKSTLEKIYLALPDSDFDSNATKKMLQGIIEYLESSTGDIKRQQELISYLDQIDRRRNLNWQQTFPWLKNVV